MSTDPIKKAKNGTYYFRINLGYDINGKKIQKYKSGFKTKNEARKSFAELSLSFNPTEEKREKILFKDYLLEIFLPWYKSQVKIQTYENRISTAKAHFSYFYGYLINKIKPIDIQNLQIELTSKFKPSYVRNCSRTFINCL